MDFLASVLLPVGAFDASLCAIRAYICDLIFMLTTFENVQFNFFFKDFASGPADSNRSSPYNGYSTHLSHNNSGVLFDAFFRFLCSVFKIPGLIDLKLVTLRIAFAVETSFNPFKYNTLFAIVITSGFLLDLFSKDFLFVQFSIVIIIMV